MPPEISESGVFGTTNDTASSGVIPIQILTPGWGSSGYYSKKVVESAASLVQPGTHMYLDHPTETDERERPERSVREIAAVVTSEAAWDPARQALVAEATVVPALRETIGALAPYIGLSIRGSATDVVEGEAEGRRGRIIAGLARIDSVDFVTRAGRGGRVLELLESARGLRETTSNDVRDALAAAIEDSYGGAEIYTWVRDYDADLALVYFEVSGGEDTDARGTFQQTYAISADGAAELSGERQEVTPRTTFVPVNPAGPVTTQESKEGPMAKIEIEESEHQRLVEEAGRVKALESERDAAVQERDAAKAEADKAKAVAGSPRAVIEASIKERDETIAQLSAEKRAREVIAETLDTAWLTPTVVSRLQSELLESLPIVDHKLDEAALRDKAVKARDLAETEVAEALSAAGVGKPRGLGGTHGGEASTDVSDRLAESFKSLGMSESSAQIAAKGR